MAIAYDSSISGTQANGVASITWNHVCTGSNLFLLVFCIDSTGNDRVTGVTYNGVSMTQTDKNIDATNGSVYTYTLASPATGTHAVVVNANPNTNLDGLSISYTGVLGIDAHAVATLDTQNPSPTLTTVADKSWVIMATQWQSSTPTAGANTSLRIAGDVFIDVFESSNNPITPAGTTTLNWTSAGSQHWVINKISLSPFTSMGGMLNFFLG